MSSFSKYNDVMSSFSKYNDFLLSGVCVNNSFDLSWHLLICMYKNIYAKINFINFTCIMCIAIYIIC